LPFVEAAAKAKVAGSVEAQSRHHLAALLDEQTLSVERLPRRSLDEGVFSALVSSPPIGAGREGHLQRLGSSVGRAVD